MRTWTLRATEWDIYQELGEEWNPQHRKSKVIASGSQVVPMGREKAVEVIELEPVLDLLEDIKTDIKTIALRGRSGCDGFAEEAVDDLLKAHGRLGEREAGEPDAS